MKLTGMLMIGLILAAGGAFATHVWNGAGVTGGTGGTNWLDAANWLVDGTPPAAPPSLDDDATIDLNVNPPDPFAVIVGSGATARHVSFSGMNDTARKAAILGNATFSTLNYATTKNTLSIAADATLTLTGGELNPDGTVVKKTFSTPAPFSIYSVLSYAGAIRCTGDQVVLHPMNGVAGKIYIDNPNATVSFNGGTVLIGSELHVYETQRMLGFNETVGISPLRDNGGRIYNQSGNALTNWYACRVGGNVLNTTALWFTLAAGTYRSISASSASGYTRQLQYEISGDVTVAGTNTDGRAVFVSRRYQSYYALLRLNGHDLTATGGGSIGICAFDDSETTWNGRIEAPGSTVSTDGSIEIGPGGYFTGDANTVIAYAGDWDNRSQYKKTAFTLHAATMKAIGSAHPRAPQLIEAQSVDLGPTTDGMLDNHAVGSLVVGTPTQPTHARLVDVDDFTFDTLADAFYAGSLVIHEGSTLDINGLELYVNGVSVRHHFDEYGDGVIIDSTIPSATLIVVK